MLVCLDVLRFVWVICIVHFSLEQYVLCDVCRLRFVEDLHTSISIYRQ